MLLSKLTKTRRAALLLLPFLLLVATVPSPPVAAQQEGKYSVAGIDDERAVEKFLAQLQQAVAADDHAAVASMVSYPVRVYNGKRRATVLRKKSDLLKKYDAVFNRKVRDSLAGQKMEELFVNWQGVMIGNGEIWFREVGDGGKLKIVTINN